jgi:hypothetical protein
MHNKYPDIFETGKFYMIYVPSIFHFICHRSVGEFKDEFFVVG